MITRGQSAMLGWIIGMLLVIAVGSCTHNMIEGWQDAVAERQELIEDE